KSKPRLRTGFLRSILKLFWRRVHIRRHVIPWTVLLRWRLLPGVWPKHAAIRTPLTRGTVGSGSVHGSALEGLWIVRPFQKRALVLVLIVNKHPLVVVRLLVKFADALRLARTRNPDDAAGPVGLPGLTTGR